MRPYRIGLVAAHSTIDYPHALRLGIQNTLEELGHTLVAVAELVPYHTPDNGESHLRVALEIARRLELDSVIVPVGCLAPYVGRDNDKAVELALTMDPANTLIVEREFEGYRCVLKDNEPGMHECMRHLIETCGFTRIAFLAGPEKSKGSREREAVYFAEMAAHGLPTPPELFGRGDFAGHCDGVVEGFLDACPDLEAIVCAADLLAYTAYDVCRARKLTVGEDIAITGFDDHPRSAHMDPPLSTVHITSYDLGCMAAREAVRMAAGEPQQEHVLKSTFKARNSCGEDVRGGVAYFRALLRQDPLPADEIVDAVLEATLSMAGPSVAADFRAQLASYLKRIREAYHSHLAQPHEEVLLFSSHDLNNLFAQGYREHLSLEGFHTTAIEMLEALMEESGEDANWIIEQISHLHLRIARLLSTSTVEGMLENNEREWHTLHMVDNALREDRNPSAAYRLILEQFAQIGIRQADVFLLPEPVDFIGARAIALSDDLLPIGRVVNGQVEVAEGEGARAFQGLLDECLPRYAAGAVCTIGGVMAGNELLGIAAVDAGNVSVHGQLMGYLNLGFALKHLQVIASEREMNSLLNQNNLLLEQESQHDEMTGALNRRGFINRLEHLMQVQQGSRAAFMYLDLDGLKAINDTFGHDVGDEAIRATARILAGRITGDDLLCRLGGDEFVAYVRLERDAEAAGLAEAIQDDIADFNAGSAGPFTLGISAGWHCFTVDGNSFSQRAQLLAEADDRLYEMKRERKQSRRYERGAQRKDG